MYRKIDQKLAQTLIKNIICLALKRKDNTIVINEIRLIPKAVIVEAGKIIKYEVELYSIDKSLLKSTIKEIVLTVTFNEHIAELTITVDEKWGHMYFIPSSLVNENLLDRILNFILTRADCN